MKKVKKIRPYLFELVCGFTLICNVSLIFVCCIGVFTIVNNNNLKYFMISVNVMIVIILSSIFIILVSLFVSKNSKKNIVIDNNVLAYNGEKYDCSCLSFKYYSCKWYAIPIFYIYKSERGGLIEISYNAERIMVFKGFYSDYLKLKNVIKDSLIV